LVEQLFKSALKYITSLIHAKDIIIKDKFNANQGLLIMTGPVGSHLPEAKEKFGLHLLHWRTILIASQF
jgi:hypothetical protein